MWHQAWVMGSRAVSATSTVRAASHFLRSMVQTETIKNRLTGPFVIETLFAGGTNGPCMLVDAAFDLFTTTLRSGMFPTERLFEEFSFHVVGWLKLLWNLR